jgi:hypothetical protein
MSEISNRSSGYVFLCCKEHCTCDFAFFFYFDAYLDGVQWLACWNFFFGVCGVKVETDWLNFSAYVHMQCIHA